MNRVIKAAPVVLLFTLIIAVPSVWANWVPDGAPVCTAVGGQESPAITSDGAGGAIITWADYRSGGADIYAQRVNASGAVQWTANGVALCTATGDQGPPTIVSDGAGGAIVTWYDYRSGSNYDIYAQRVNASGAVQWTANGVALCTATGNQYSTTMTSDGASGAIVTWHDYRTGSYADIYAQRVNASGVVQWAANGVALCSAVGGQEAPQIASDGAGGAIVTWEDARSGSTIDIYAQTVNASGAVQWTANGVALCTATGFQWYPTIVSDGASGAIVTWEDERGGTYDIYAQHVSASGAIQWTPGGFALCTATGDQRSPMITSDGAGGAIVTWSDARGVDTDIYAQSADRRPFSPDILSIHDVSHDQGGWVGITIDRSKLDAVQVSIYPVSTYNVWQRIDNQSLLAMVAAGSTGAAPDARINEAPLKHSVDASSVSNWPVKELNGRYFVESKELLGAGSFPAGTWELLGSFAAYQQNQYVYLASTVADSTASGIPHSVYVVSAHTTTPSVWFASDPDSGYSVDNIPPEVPGGLVAEERSSPFGLALSWNVSAANDFSHYAVYRGTSAAFVPGPGNRVGTSTAPEYFDGSWRWSGGYYYKVSAIDVHDNQSGFALLRPDDVTGTDTPKAPEASYLAQNFPNPFNPTTRIEFGLSVPGHVSLRIYDAAGRLVRALVNEERRAGKYDESWDGRDSSGHAVPSGVYFCRLSAGSFEQTRKMALLR